MDAVPGPMDPERRSEIERRLGYRFASDERLQVALTHSSAKPEGRPSYERLEFLGDAVIGLVVSDFLFAAFPERDEGELTRIKSAVVSESALASCAARLRLDLALDAGKGVKKDGIPASIQADVFEAVSGAIYLDGGLEAARRFVLLNLAPAIESVLGARNARNWKSILQQYTQRLLATTPTYEVVRAVGPDHVKEFEVVALVKGEVRGAGRGRSKKVAEQAAARAALEALIGGAAPSKDAHTLEKLADELVAPEDAQAENGA
ncbi:ribonuclease III [bacterium]|nr:ribonuclease III [bacterium]